MKNLAILFLLGMSLLAKADTGHDFFDRLAITGFVYTTQFSDNNWHRGRTIGVANFDIHDEQFAFRGQLSTYKDQHLRRAVIEYSHPVGSTVEMVYQLGRFTRVESFYEGITDNPGSYRQALLPMAGYNYRMLNGAFVILDGAKAQATFKLPNDYLATLSMSLGHASIPNQVDIQKEAFGRTIPGVNVTSTNKNYDINLHVKHDNLYGYISKNRYNFTVQPLTTSSTALATSSAFNEIEYSLSKIGLKWDNDDFVLQGEAMHGVTYVHNANRTAITSTTNAFDYNWLAGKQVKEDVFAYVGRSLGQNKTRNTRNNDTFIGVSYIKPKWTTSIEYHQGRGRSWARYDVLLSPGTTTATWNSWVVSATYRF